MTPRYDRIREGLCPECDAPLERREDHGRCPNGHGGWSVAGDDIGVHIEVDTSALEAALDRLKEQP